METHSRKKKNKPHLKSKEDTIQNKNSKKSNNPQASSLIPKQNFICKIFEIFAIIFKKHDKSSLFKAIDKLVDHCEVRGFVAAEEKKMIRNIINIGDVKVDDVMTPRTDIVAVKQSANLDEIRELIISKEHTRIPVYRENLDEVVGFIHSKDIVGLLGEKAGEVKIKSIVRKILYVPHSMRVIDLLLKMRASQVHIAIVLDEYGGTDGLVTIEDIMEEIVGEIEDEHDVPDDNIYMTIKKIDNHILQVGGRVEIEKIEELLSEKIINDNDEAEFDTVGGLVLATLKKIPEIGEEFKHSSGLGFKVIDADMRSVKLVEISKERQPEEHPVSDIV